MTEQTTPLWRVTKVEDVNIYTPTHGTTRGKRVRYTVHDGTQSYVDVPVDQYNAQTVQDAIHTAVLKHEQVMGLGGPDANGPLPSVTPTIPNLIV